MEQLEDTVSWIPQPDALGLVIRTTYQPYYE